MKKILLIPNLLTIGLVPIVSMVGCGGPDKPVEEINFTTTTGQMSSATEASFQLDWTNGHSLTFANSWSFTTSVATVKSITASGGDTKPQTISITFDAEITANDITDGKLTFTYNDLTAKKDNVSTTIENICITKYTPPPEEITINLLKSIGGTVKTESYSVTEGTQYIGEVKNLIDSQAQPNDGCKFTYWADQENNPISEGHTFLAGETIVAHFETLQDCFKWKIGKTNDQTVTLDGFASEWDDMPEAVIPANVVIDDVTYTVSAISTNAFYNCTGLTQIEIPNTVKSIGNSAFDRCTGLLGIEIPDSVTNIGGSAFYSCTNLAKLTLSVNLAKIESRTFYDCGKLQEVEIPDSVTSIDNYAFRYCAGIKKLTIGAGVANIGELVFDKCPVLETIKVDSGNQIFWSSDAQNDYNCIVQRSTTDPVLILGCKNTIIPSKSVTKIADYAFRYSVGLTEITIPNNIKSIGSYAFHGCTKLTKVEIPDSVTSIGDHAFYDCSSLTTLNIPTSLTTIGDHTFQGCNNLTPITIPIGVLTIDEFAFEDCFKLTEIEIPDSVTSIGNGIFAGCTGLETIKVDSKNQKFWSSAGGVDYNCVVEKSGTDQILKTGCAKTKIPNNITSIGNSAFLKCKTMTSITIPASVTNISDNAFHACTQLEKIDMTAFTTPPTLGEFAFFQCPNNFKILVAKGMGATFQSAAGWSEYTNNIVEVGQDI